eukprot:CAMPEP_0185841010 /NCGR_PEP_ID=MMETSP1353-20130828/17178_1 /TAXON_ID=1077150 /ORGANISM="Erythrolobus australicus, Strain CCMP3124" /LENGTH=249 /DNA_ID=CAMNT_0028540413 /DNA_START=230 /DNA_END=975 /DNA_ORIENTATION=-
MLFARTRAKRSQHKSKHGQASARLWRKAMSRARGRRRSKFRINQAKVDVPRAAVGQSEVAFESTREADADADGRAKRRGERAPVKLNSAVDKRGPLDVTRERRPKLDGATSMRRDRTKLSIRKAAHRVLPANALPLPSGQSAQAPHARAATYCCNAARAQRKVQSSVGTDLAEALHIVPDGNGQVKACGASQAQYAAHCRRAPARPGCGQRNLSLPARLFAGRTHHILSTLAAKILIRSIKALVSFNLL